MRFRPVFFALIPGTKSLLASLALLLTSTAVGMMTEAEFAEEMAAKHGLDADFILSNLQRAQHQDSIIAAMTRPAEAMPWHRYRTIFLTDTRTQGGVAFYQAHKDLLQRAEREYGVDPYVITAIIGVETNYGANTGSHRVIDALKTLGFGYPPRAEFFRTQLGEFFLMAQEEGFDPQEPKGSYAGAMGMPQFIPSSFRAYAIDFDGDGRRDFWGSTDDVIGSVANYLAVHGWQAGQPIAVALETRPVGLEPGSRRGQKPNLIQDELLQAGVDLRAYAPQLNQAALIELEMEDSMAYWLGFDNFYAITRYNHSNLYAMAVTQLAEAIRLQAN